MRNTALLCTALFLMLCPGAWAQGPMAIGLGTAAFGKWLGGGAVETRATGVVRNRAVTLLRVEGPDLAQATVPAFAASLMPDRFTPATNVLMDRVQGGGRLGALVGWTVGLAVGPVLFAGNDMGCDESDCYGRLSTRGSLLAGGVVMGGLGFLCGSAMGALSESRWWQEVPLEGVHFSMGPRGKPGLKLSASLRF